MFPESAKWKLGCFAAIGGAAMSATWVTPPSWLAVLLWIAAAFFFIWALRDWLFPRDLPPPFIFQPGSYVPARALPLREAAVRYYKHRRDTDQQSEFIKLAEKPYQGKTDIIGYVGTYLISKHLVIYAKRSPLNQFEPIPTGYLAKCRIEGEAADLKQPDESGRPFYMPVVLVRDLSLLIKA